MTVIEKGKKKKRKTNRCIFFLLIGVSLNDQDLSTNISVFKMKKLLCNC